VSFVRFQGGRLLIAALEAFPSDRDKDTTVLGVTRLTALKQFAPKHLDPAIEAAHVERFTTQGLRRTAVDALARAGVDIGTICEITGHSEVTMLKLYREANMEAKRRAITQAGLGDLGNVARL